MNLGSLLRLYQGHGVETCGDGTVPEVKDIHRDLAQLALEILRLEGSSVGVLDLII